MNIRAHVCISGKVQGVFFRAETRREARKLHLTGWIRNLPDGRVEAVFEGEEAGVRSIVEFCRKGSRGARVTNVSIEWEPFIGGFEGFEVRSGFGF